MCLRETTLKNSGIIINQKKGGWRGGGGGGKGIEFFHKSHKYNSYKGTIGKVKNNKTNRRFKTSIAYQKITNDMLEFIKYI